MTNLRTFILIVAIAVSADRLSARLEFAQTTLRLIADAGTEEALLGEFKFTNRAGTPTKIIAVDPACGCTTTTLAQFTYQPDEPGEIGIKFHVGTQVGHTVKTISVVTDEPSNNRYTLSLDVDIVEWFSVSPRLLYWRPDETPNPKLLTITLANPEVRVVGIATPSDIFHAQFQENREPDTPVIVVTPLSRQPGTSATLTIDFQVGHGRLIQQRVFLRILPNSTMPAPF